MVSGKEFRQSLHKPLPNSPPLPKECRLVPAFTIQAIQRGTCVIPPPKCNPFRVRPAKPSSFKSNYDRGEFPLGVSSSKEITWKVDLDKLDYHHYLPLLFEGLSETQEPYMFIAQQGIHDMLLHGGKKIFPCIPQLIIPIKNALNTKNNLIMRSTLKVLQHLVKSGDYIGEALVPYYRQILPVLNIFKERNVNCGDGIDYSQGKGENLADIINETLETLEEYGGEDAFINIKYLIPTYESCIMN